MRKQILALVLMVFFNAALADNQASGVQIVEPVDQSTLWDNQGNVKVVAEVKPSMPSGDKVQLLIDYNNYGDQQLNPVWQLKNIPRGSHQLQVQLVDASGNVIISSATILFYLHKAGVKKT